MRKSTLLLSFLFTGSFLYSQSYLTGDTMTVVALDGLNIRLQPGIQAEKIGKLPIGDKVVIIEKKVRINEIHSGFNGDWIKIKSCHDSTEGYIFDAFVSQFPLIQEMVISDKTIKNDASLDNGEYLLEILETYALMAFKAKPCKSTYFNGFDGTGAHTFTILPLENEHRLVSHSGYEWVGTELELKNAHPSEIYYLVLHLLQFISKEAYTMDDSRMRNTQYTQDPVVELYPEVRIFIKRKRDGCVSIYIATVTS